MLVWTGAGSGTCYRNLWVSKTLKCLSGRQFLPNENSLCPGRGLAGDGV